MKFAATLLAAVSAAPAQLIIGGSNASDKQFPWQVSLKRATGSHYCGGSIIKNNVVMCAAHCKQSTNSFTAGAGSASLNGQRQVLNISQQIPHPSYDAQRIDWDYMVIKTTSNFEFDDYVKPIALVSSMDSELPNKTPCRTSGYGYSQYINGNPGVIASSLLGTLQVLHQRLPSCLLPKRRSYRQRLDPNQRWPLNFCLFDSDKNRQLSINNAKSKKKKK